MRVYFIYLYLNSNIKANKMFECVLCEYECKNKADIFRHTETKKHLIHFNTEQQELLLQIIKYMESPNVDGKDGIRINSAGGTGKTFTVSSIMKYITNCKALGPTHQSVSMLRKQNFEAETFHKFFGWGQVIDENNKEINVWNPPTIPKNTIFVFDEISMMTRAQYSLFKHFIYGKFKYIMMGDKCQIPPFENKDDDILPDDVPLIKNTLCDLSLSFQFKCVELNLVKNMRTKNPKLNEILYNMRNNVLNNKSIHLVNNWKLDYETVKQNINRDYIFIAHQNSFVDKFNTDIRNYLFPDSKNSQLQVGDKISLKTFSIAINKHNNNSLFRTTFLQSGSRFTISYFEDSSINVPENILEENGEVIDFKAYEIELDNKYIIRTLDRDYKESFNKWYKDNCNTIKKIKSTKLLPLTEKELSDIKKKYYKLLRKYRDLNIEWNFSFASTINKAQGASYDLVFVYNFGTKFFNNKCKYTACSRVASDLKIFS